MPDDDDPDAVVEAAIHHGVGKDSQRKHAATFRGRCAEAGVLDQQLGDPLELDEKPACYSIPGVLTEVDEHLRGQVVTFNADFDFG